MSEGTADATAKKPCNNCGTTDYQTWADFGGGVVKCWDCHKRRNPGHQTPASRMTAWAKEHGLKVGYHRTKTDWQDRRWYAEIERINGKELVEYKEHAGSGVLSSAVAFGPDCHEALNRLAETLSGKLLVINAMGYDRRHLQIPDFWQPEPQPDTGQQAVAPALKQRFNDWIDERTAKGVQTYGQPLMTHNGRSARKDSREELLDFCQYQHQYIMELEDKVERLESERESLRNDVATLRGVIAHVEQVRKDSYL